MNPLRQGTATVVQIGPFISSQDGTTLYGEVIPQWLHLLKGASWVWGRNDPTPIQMGDDFGWVSVPLDATDTNTVGRFVVRAGIANALPVWNEFTVLPQAVYDALVAGTGAMAANLTRIMGDSLAGNNAVLNLKRINVVNDAADYSQLPAVHIESLNNNPAVRMRALAEDGLGLHIHGGAGGAVINGLGLYAPENGSAAVDIAGGETSACVQIINQCPTKAPVAIGTSEAQPCIRLSTAHSTAVDLNGSEPATALAVAGVASAVMDIWTRLGAFTGTGVNTVLGFFRALLRKDQIAPSDIGGGFDPATDSLEALKDAGVPSTNAAAPGEAMTLTVAYDAAKSAAQAGDAMALTPAAVTQVKSGLATPGDAMTLTPDSITQVQSGLAQPGDAMALTPDAVAQVRAGLAQPGDAMSLTPGYDAAKSAAQPGDAMNLTPEALVAVGGSDSAPTVEEIADAVWDEVAEHNAPGTTGAKLNSAGTAGDPWTKALPGSYAAGTAGAILGAMSGSKVVVQSPVAANGLLRLVQADSYDDGKLAITVEWTGEDLAGADVHLLLLPREHYQAESDLEPVAIDCELEADGNSVTVTMPITDELSALFEGTPSDSAPNYVYQIVATKGERRHTLALGPAIVRKKVG